MEVKPGYKQTEVGVIPEDWAVTKLGEHATFKTGPFGSALHQSDYIDGGVPVINPMQIVDGRIQPTTSMAITEQAARKLSDFRLSRGDVVIGRRGDMGRCALVQPEQHGWLCGTGSMIVRAGASLDGRFIQRVLSSSPIIAAIESASVGSTMVNLNQSTLGNLLVPLPPSKAEQDAIAEALSDADAHIESLEQLVAKKRLLKQGAMQELLTGKRRLPGFSGNWEVKRLGDVLYRVSNGAVYKPTDSFGLPITRIETISDGTIDYSRIGIAESSSDLENYKMVLGDILFSHINSLDHIGKVAQFHGERDLYHGMNLLLLRTNKDADNRFLYFWFTSSPTRKKARSLAKQAVNQASINTKELKALEILLPPLSEQEAIAAILSDMDAGIAALEAKLTKVCQLKQGMIQELITGKTRLI
jgi:type I restriction enzyme S subunit